MTRFHGRLLAALCLALALAGPTAAAELDLERAVALALSANPALKAVEEQRNEVLGGVREVRADAYPQLALVTGWNQVRNPSLLNSKDFADFIDLFPGGFKPQATELYGLSIELTQPLYTFGKVNAALDLARLVVDVTDQVIATARLDTAVAAAEAYYGVLAARKGLETIEVQREERRAAQAEVMSRFEVGEATELERLRAAALLAEVEPEVARLSGVVAVAEGRLRQVLALPVEEPLALAYQEATLPPAPELPALLAMARERRPETAGLELQREIAERRKVVTRAGGLPQIELTGAYGREVRLVDNLDDPLFANWRVGVNLRWEFWDSGRRRGQIAQFASQTDQLNLRLADLEQRIQVEVKEGLTSYDTARARLTAARASASAAREAARVARANYEEGVALLTDLLDAQRQATQAEVQEVAAYYEAQIAAARLSRALGLLPTAVWPTAAAPSEN